jgi:outer membrane protein assembly factor BamB
MGGGKKVVQAIPEDVITSTLMKLVPDGRIFSNDLSVDEPFLVRGAWLFDREIVLEDLGGDLISLHKRDLSPYWVFTGVPGVSEFGLVTSPISVVLISEGILYEVDRKYGTQRSANVLDFIPAAAPAATDSTAYVPSLAGRAGHRTLNSVNLASGVEGWGLSTRTSISTPPVRGGTLARPVIYFATEGRGVFAIPAESAHSGAPDPKWTHGADGRIVAAPVLDRDLLLIGSEKGELWALDRITGATAWVHYSGEPIRRAAWASGDQVYFINSRGFHALDRSNGKELWSVAEITIDEDAVVTEPLTFLVRRGDTVYVHSGDGRVYALDGNSGELLRWAQFHEDVRFLTNGVDHILYLVTPTGFLFAVDKQIE